MPQYGGGGTKYFFLLILYNLKKLGEGLEGGVSRDGSS